MELQPEAELVRGLVRKTAWELDRVPHMQISDKVSMCKRPKMVALAWLLDQHCAG